MVQLDPDLVWADWVQLDSNLVWLSLNEPRFGLIGLIKFDWAQIWSDWIRFGLIGPEFDPWGPNRIKNDFKFKRSLF